MTEARERARVAKSVARRDMHDGITTEIRLNRASLAADVAALPANYDLNNATDLRQTFAVATKRAIVELDRMGHDEALEPMERMACLRASADASLRGQELYSKLANPESAGSGVTMRVRVVEMQPADLDALEREQRAALGAG